MDTSSSRNMSSVDVQSLIPSPQDKVPVRSMVASSMRRVVMK